MANGDVVEQPPHAEGGVGTGGSLQKAEATCGSGCACHSGAVETAFHVRKGKPFVEVASGTIVVRRIAFKG